VNQHCVVCGQPFTFYADPNYPQPDTCGSADCLVHYAKRFGFDPPKMCSCAQRPHKHDIAVHAELRSESYNPKLKYRWPWSLMLSPREEPSTERKQAA
jgi:hypothetical protein